MRRRSTRRGWVSWIVGAALALGVVVPVNLLATAAPAEALSGAQFDPGFIISDPLFYDSNSMSAAQIQAFLDQHIGVCRNGQCLNVLSLDYGGRALDRSVNGNLICNAIPGGHYSIAQLVFTVQQACGISAKVILVTMQKEQSLATNTAPSLSQLSHAMGFACPDTAPCDPSYAGVANQIVGGTRQLKAYNHAQGSGPGTLFGKPVGNQYVQYNPNGSCGGSYVNVRNYATAALYSYTPYQPNQAALNNLYGTGDSCSAYGNRNFWVDYTTWFGSTTYDVGGDIGAYFNSLGDSAFTLLGAPQANQVCGLRDGGCFQQFAFGQVYWSPVSGAHRTTGAMHNEWVAAAGLAGAFGYPTTDPIYVDGARPGFVQFFQGGMTTLVDGLASYIPDGGLETRFRTEGPSGAIGWPTARPTVLSDGVYQSFDGGIYYSKSGADARRLTVAMSTSYLADGGPTGELGWPTADTSCDGGGCSQPAENGTIVAPGPTAAGYGLLAASYSYWQQSGGGSGPFGWPTANDFPVATSAYGSGRLQFFTGGAFAVSDAHGIVAVPAGALLTEFRRLGPGVLGWPTAPSECFTGGTCAQPFDNSALVATAPGPVYEMSAPAYAKWVEIGASAGALGDPSTQAFGVTAGSFGNGSLQFFRGGVMAVSDAHGAAAIQTGAVLDMFRKQGPATLGWPTDDSSCDANGCVLPLDKTSVISVSGAAPAAKAGAKTAAVTVSASGTAYLIDSSALALWQSLGGFGSRLGTPTGDVFAVKAPQGTGSMQFFTGGAITVSSHGAVSLQTGPILVAFRAQGPGQLGWPLAEAACASDASCEQAFESVALIATPGGTISKSTAAIAERWAALGGGSGSIGLPTNDAFAVTTMTYGTGKIQFFAGGAIVESAAHGVAVIPAGPVLDAFRTRGPATVGWPTGNATCSAGACTQTFDGATLP